MSAHWLARVCASLLLLAAASALATDPPANSAQTDASTTAGPPNAEEPPDFWTGPINGPVPLTLSGGSVIHTQELNELLKTGGVILIDVSNLPRRPENLAPGAPWLQRHPPLPHRT